MVHAARLGHPGGDLSAADILATLFFHTLRVDPGNPRDPARDRFILSKGHASAALYATLAEAGFFPREDLDTFMQPLSMLSGHPDRNKVPGVEANTGPLGHGLPIAVGAALAAKMRPSRVAHVRAHRRRRTAGGQQLGGNHGGEPVRLGQPDRHRRPQPPPAGRRAPNARWPSSRSPTGGAPFGWAVVEVDGHDHAALARTFDALPRRAGAADLRHRTHRQGTRRLVHGGPGRVASPRAHRRRAAISRCKNSARTEGRHEREGRLPRRVRRHARRSRRGRSAHRRRGERLGGLVST